MFQIGDRIKELRKQRNMTQAELAETIGIRQESMNRMEKGRYNPSYEVLYELCHALDVSLSDFFSKKASELSSDLQQLMETAKKLTPEERKKLNEFLKVIKENR